jgi:hypothetical protein
MPVGGTVAAATTAVRLAVRLAAPIGSKRVAPPHSLAGRGWSRSCARCWPNQVGDVISRS